MLKLLYITIFFLFPYASFSQSNIEKELMTIKNTEEAKKYMYSNFFKEKEIIHFNRQKDTSSLAKAFFKMGNDFVKTIENTTKKTYYKVVERNKNIYHRLRYIYIDGKKISSEEINELEDKITKKYKKGVAFPYLVKQYSMADNHLTGGDSGWFKEGDGLYDFEKSIIIGNYDTNNIFVVSIPTKKHYYIILKTHAPKEVEEIKVLKITEAIE